MVVIIVTIRISYSYFYCRRGFSKVEYKPIELSCNGR